jgi:hypothetical protein
MGHGRLTGGTWASLGVQEDCCIQELKRFFFNPHDSGFDSVNSQAAGVIGAVDYFHGRKQRRIQT